MRNKYAGKCFRCQRQVEAGEGFFQRMKGRWFIRCQACVGQGSVPQTAGEATERIETLEADAIRAKDAIDRLVNALEPFAREAESVDEDNFLDHDHIWKHHAAMNINAGDLRKARSALEEVTGGRE